jgi:hypothetical protein
MKNIAKARIKKQHLLLLSVAAVALIGTVGAMGFGGFGGFFTGPNHVYNATSYNGMPYNGMPVHRYNGANTYNGIPAHAMSYNATNAIKANAAVDQCKTTYVNSVSSIASSNAGITVSPTQVDQANANLQSNVTANATSWNTRISFAFFTNAFQDFMLHYMLATHQLNSTAATSLSAALNSTRTSLQNCVSSNSTIYAQPWPRLRAPTFGWFSGAWFH